MIYHTQPYKDNNVKINILAMLFGPGGGVAFCKSAVFSETVRSCLLPLCFRALASLVWLIHNYEALGIPTFVAASWFYLWASQAPVTGCTLKPASHYEEAPGCLGEQRGKSLHHPDTGPYQLPRHAFYPCRRKAMRHFASPWHFAMTSFSSSVCRHTHPGSDGGGKKLSPGAASCTAGLASNSITPHHGPCGESQHGCITEGGGESNSKKSSCCWGVAAPIQSIMLQTRLAFWSCFIY